MLAPLRRFGAWLQRLPRWAGPLLALAWMALIWQLSNLPSSDERASFPKGWLTNAAHAPLFGLLALWWILALPRREGWPVLGRAALLAVLGAVLAYGALDEWHQSSVPGRDASVLDLATDVVGAACTLWLAAYVGTPGASAGGTLRRIGLGLLFCALAGLAATCASFGGAAR